MRSTTDSDKQYPSGIDYADHFDVHAYMRTRFSGVENPNNVQPVSFQMQSFHEFYKNSHSCWDPLSARLLEFGCGPSIYPVIAACPHFKDVVLADYTESLLREVRLWKERDMTAHDWSDFFRYQVNQLEDKNGKEAVTEREELLREKITTIEHCDITKQNPIDVELGSFDVVSSSYCLEAVAHTMEEYERFLIRLAGVTRIGGYIVTLVSIGMSYYLINGEKFTHLSLSMEATRNCLENAGFVVEMNRYYPLEEHRRVRGGSNCEGKAFFVGCRVR